MIIIREATTGELDALTPLLLLAEPSPRALRWSLEHMVDAAYRLEVDGQVMGAATMRWRGEACEIVELAVAPEEQGKGLGRQLVAWLLEEGRRRGKGSVVVGTSTTSVGNILFYQKCGFRAEAIRRDYFWYYDTPQVEHGLPVRDMIVFRYELGISRHSPAIDAGG